MDIPDQDKNHMTLQQLRHCAACGTCQNKFNDLDDIQRNLLPIYFHTRCFKINEHYKLHGMFWLLNANYHELSANSSKLFFMEING